MAIEDELDDEERELLDVFQMAERDGRVVVMHYDRYWALKPSEFDGPCVLFLDEVPATGRLAHWRPRAVTP